jgi:ornithine cyclodeaminase
VNAFSYETGLPIAVLDGAAITNLKCAAITGYFTQIGAPDDADTLALIGAGVQAKHQFLGVAAVLPIKRVQIYSRSLLKASQFATELAVAYPKVSFIVCDSIAEAQIGAQILSTATSCNTPLINELDPACKHINCIGGYTHSSREISRDIFSRAILFVEDRATAVQEAGFEHSQALDLRSEPESFNTTLKNKLTLFSSTGHSSLDLITSWHILQQSVDL